MKAAIFKAAGQPLVIEEIPDPTPDEGELIIKVSHCGVCGTDLHATSGHGWTLPNGSQLGHEYSGEVVAVGTGVASFKIGDRLAGMPVIGCGRCEHCRTGIDVLCGQRRSYSGAVAEYARVNARGAVELPAGVSLADGALVEPLAVGRRAVRLVNPTGETRVLVIGPGPIGLAVLFWLRHAGVRNIAVLASTCRRKALAQSMGSDHFILESDGATGQVQVALNGSPDVVFEAAGVPGVMARAIELVRPQGMILSLGFCMVPDRIIPGLAMLKDVSIRFSTTYTRQDFADSAQALAQQGGRARAMVTDTVSLDDFPDAFETLRQGRGNAGKLVVDLRAT